MSRSPIASAPLTLDLPRTLVAKVESIRKARGLDSASAALRLAIERFDFARFNPRRVAHLQVSFRVTAEQRRTLKRVARSKDASIGELVRAALEAVPLRSKR